MTQEFDIPDPLANASKVFESGRVSLDALTSENAGRILAGLTRGLTTNSTTRAFLGNSDPIGPTLQDFMDMVAGAGLRDYEQWSGTFPCVSCDLVFTGIPGLRVHLAKEHPIVEDAFDRLAQLQAEGKKMHAVRTGVSNRHLIDQMLAWGWEDDGRKGDLISMRFPPRDNHLIRVQQPGNARGNPAPIFIAVYDITGVTSDAFWKGPQPTREQEAPMSPAARTEQARQISTPLLDLLIGQGRPLTLEYMAESMGFTVGQVSGAMSYMGTLNLVRKVKRGMWMAVAQHADSHDIGVDVTTTSHHLFQDPPGPTIAESTPVPVAPVTVPLQASTGSGKTLGAPLSAPVRSPIVDEGTIEDLVDMLVGPGALKAKHARLTVAALDALQVLITQVYADQEK